MMWRKKLFLYQLVLVCRLLYRLPERMRSKRLCQGYEGSEMIFPAHFLDFWCVQVCFWSVWWLYQTRLWWRSTGQIQWMQCRTVTAAPMEVLFQLSQKVHHPTSYLASFQDRSLLLGVQRTHSSGFQMSNSWFGGTAYVVEKNLSSQTRLCRLLGEFH